VGLTYSSAFGATFGTETSGARSIYQTLTLTDEKDYTGFAVKDDLTVLVFQPVETPKAYLDRVMAGISASYTSANATIIYSRYITRADKSRMNSIFASAQADSSWDAISTDYSSDTSKVRGLFEDVFDNQQFSGLMYGVLNTTDWTASKTTFDYVDDALTNTSHPVLPGAVCWLCCSSC